MAEGAVIPTTLVAEVVPWVDARARLFRNKASAPA